MLSDDELAAEIEIDEAKPKKAKAAPAKQMQAPEIEGDEKRKVWVRCVSDREPWDSEKPLKYWVDYEINIKDAMLLESKQMVVILETPSKKG